MSNKMGREKRGPLALELWAKQLIDGYPGVCVRNMTTSWRNGLAFCALIHRFRPDLIDYDKLDPSDIIGNCALAFDTAESKLGIPALLDPEDMLNLEVPDRLSVLTYVAQFYSVFKNAEAKSARVVPRTGVNEEDNLKTLSGDKSKSSSPEKVAEKRKMEVNQDEIMDKVKKSMPKKSIMLSASNVCSECKNPVFISERILFMKKLFHRTCFRCSYCTNPLNPHVADVSPDGLLFCAETNCHLELLKKFHVSSHPANSLEVPKEALQIPDSATAASPEIISVSVVDSSNDKENVPSEEHHLHDSPRDGIKTAEDVLLGDPQRQEDSRLEPKEVTVPLRLEPNRLMNFAGAMLLANQHNSEDSETKENANEPVEKITDSSSQLSVSKPEDLKPIYTQKEEPAPEHALLADVDAKQTPEVLCVADNSIITASDQIQVAVIEKDKIMSDLDLEPENSSSIDSNNQNTGIIEFIVDSNEPKKSFDTPGREVESDIPLVISPEESTSNSSSTKTQNTSEIKEISEHEQLEIAEREVAKSPKPKPRGESFRTTPKPSPRVERRFGSITPVHTPENLSPVPSPLPRTRVKQKENTAGSYTTSESLESDERKRNDSYPSDLNPFESEDVVNDSQAEIKITKDEPKNPFESDEDDNTSSPHPRSSTPISKQSVVEINNNKRRSQNAANFPAPPPRPPPPQLSPRKTPVSNKPYNPFEDDEDIGEYEDDKPTGIFTRGTEESSSISSKRSDLSSISSMPTPIGTPSLSLTNSDLEVSHGSLKKSRKTRRAPLPPSMTPLNNSLVSPTSLLAPQPNEDTDTPLRKKIPASPKLLRGLKNPTHLTQGYRKKRRAPFPKRRVDPLPEESIKLEFADLDVRQKELERQGIALESSIRQLMNEEETGEVDASIQNEPAEDHHNNQNEQLDEMIIQLWSIVNEKNDILRRQTELEYLRRGHRLEEMQADLEFKYRNLMDTPPDQREPNHSEMEQLLLQQLLKVVDERNEVVEWLDYHRQLDKEEDMMVSQSLNQFTNSKNNNEPIPDTSSTPVAKTKEKDKSEKKAEKDNESKSKSKDLKEGSTTKEKKGKLKLGIFSSKKKKLKAKTEEEN